MAELKTRAATPGDLDFCWGVYSEAVRPSVAPMIQGEWQESKEKGRFLTTWFPQHAHIIMLDGQPVGWLSCAEHDDRVVVEHGYIKEGFQRKKIGSILLNFIVEEAKKKGKSVVLEVLKGSSAKTFFEKTGFAESGSSQSITVEMKRSV